MTYDEKLAELRGNPFYAASALQWYDERVILIASDDTEIDTIIAKNAGQLTEANMFFIKRPGSPGC